MTTHRLISSAYALLISMLLSLPALSLGAVIELFPPASTTDCNEELENVWNAANPGDEIILNEGVYSQSCRRRVEAYGTAQEPIIIRAADGADVLITRPENTSTSHNGIEIKGSYMEIRGLRFQYGNGGVSFLGGSHHITFEDNVVFDTYDNAIRLNSGSTDSFIIRGNEVYGTGIGGATGEGMYVGCHSGNCEASNHLIENNYLHDLESQSGGGNDGIELKYNSYGNIVRGNRIDNTIIGQDYPCIFVYGYDAGAGRTRNVVENNIVSNCGEAILVTGDVIVRNNVVLSSTVNGININKQNPAPSVKNVTVVNNTVYGQPTCARINTGSGTNVVFANNALYCSGSTAVSGSLGSTVISNNYVVGNMGSGSIDNDRFFDGGSANAAFVDPANDDFNLLETSVLVDAGDDSVSDLPTTDIDGTSRGAGASIDVGAYEYADDNAPSNPNVALSVNDNLVLQGDDVTLTWTVNNADSCAASSAPVSAFSGALSPQNGSQLISNLQADIIFTLMCSNTNGNTTRMVSVTVEEPVNYQLYHDADGNFSSGEVLLSAAGELSGQIYIHVRPETNIQNVSFEIDNNKVGATEGAAPFVLDGDEGYDSNLLTDGSHTVTASITTTSAGIITLNGNFMVNNSGGPTDPPPTLDISVSPTSIMEGQSALLVWNSTNATACFGLSGVTGDLGVVDGTQTVNPITTTTYTIRCAGDGGLVTDSATLTVTPVSVDNDSDNDGLDDAWEMDYFNDLDETGGGDFEPDGLNNEQEETLGTDPTVADTDGDGITDGDEITNGTNPLVANTTGGDSGGGALGALSFLGLLALRRRKTALQSG